jgi:dTDP-4-dehydrorhamnose 3,5-epimerase-like enzyme
MWVRLPPSAQLVMNQEFGKDPMDQYSVPLESQETKLGHLFKLQPRQKPEKPGRTLKVLWDERSPLIEGFQNRYSYIVSFDSEGNTAGNHYHEKKQEIFIPLEGVLRVVLENIETKEREEVEISSSEHLAFFVPSRIAHAVTSKSESAILLVTASSAGTEEDEFPYPLT